MTKRIDAPFEATGAGEGIQTSTPTMAIEFVKQYQLFSSI